MKRYLLFFAFIIIYNLSFSQVITPFMARKTITQRGGILFLSNTSSKAVPDNIVQNEVPPSGTGYDNNYVNGYVDIDNDATTFMSSSDQLSNGMNLSNCSEVTWAGLYWGADCSSGDENFATRNQVKIKANNDAYESLTADYLKDNTAGFKTYHCFKDITAFVKAKGITSRFTVANVATDIGGKNLFGGWTIVILYKDNRQGMKNLTVFDGLANVMAGTYSTVDIPISGFQTPLAGPVNFELGIVTYDGDRSLTNDKFQFKGATSFVDIYDGLHALGDVFNSTISRNGVLTPNRNPSYNNNLGYDAAIFSPDNSTKNYIGNNAVSATIRQTTAGETYLTQVVTSAIDVYEPDIRSAVRVKNITHPGQATAEMGDILEYTVVGMNIGSDPSINTFITDTIEGNAQFVPGSITITYGPNSGLTAKTDIAGDDQAEYIASSKVVKVRIGSGANGFTGGLVNNYDNGQDSTVFKFQVKATSDCVYLACDPYINNSSHIVGTGNISGNTFSNASNPGVFDFNGCAIPGSTTTQILVAGCPSYTVTSNSPVCQGDVISFTNSYDSPSATYLWTGPNGFTSTLRQPSIPNASSANTGSYTANIFITGTNCHFVFPVPVDVTAANAGPDQTGSGTCGLTTVTLAGNAISGGGTWTVQSGTGGSFLNANSPTTTFSGTAGSSYTLRWSANAGICTATFDEVNIKFNQGPSASVLSGTSSICYNSYASLRVAVTGGTAPYTVVLNNGGGTFTNYTSGNDMIVGPIAATTTYSIVSVTDANGCTSSGLSGNATITVSGAITGTGVITQLNSPSGGDGPKTAGTATNENNQGTTWSNITNTTTSNNAYTSAALTTKSSLYLYLTNFGFAVPNGATITGIETTIERYYATTGTRTISSGSIAVGTISGTSFTRIGSSQTLSAFPLTEATTTYGNSTSMWGATSSTLTPAIVNGSNFGMRIKANVSSNGTGTATAYIDYVTLKIYYSSSYCDDATSIGFSVSPYTNATNYTWTPPTGGTVISGQGTSSAVMDFNGAGQSGNYTVSVVASNNCQTLTASSITIPLTDCTNSSLYLMGNVYWDKNAMTDNLVNGTGIGIANGTQLYATLLSSAGTTALQNSYAVTSAGTYKFLVSANTSYKVYLSTIAYTTGQTPVASLPAGCSNTGEIDNNLTNTTTGSDGTADGKISVSGFTTNNNINVNFGIKISTPPVAVNDITSTNEDVPVNFNVTTNDTDVDGTITVSTVDLDPNTAGKQTSLTNSYGSWSVSLTGLVTYTPALNFSGKASVTYTVNDNDSNTSNTATLMVIVSPVNDPPLTVNDAVTTLEDTPVDIDITSNDTDVDGTIDYTTVDLDPATSGTQTTKTVTGQGTYSVNSSGVITFTPVLNFNGVTTPISYTIKDNVGATSASATVTVTVTSIIDPPIAENDYTTTNQNTAVTINVTTNDVGVDAVINVASVDLDPLTAGIQNSLLVPGEGSYSVTNTGNVTFTPVAAFYGTTSPISYTVNDNSSNTSNIALLTVNVKASGAPVAVNDAATTNQNALVTFSVTNNDTDDGSINVSRVDFDPLTNGIQQSYYDPGKGQFIADMLGNVTFTPDWNYNGTATAQYTVKDNLNFVSNVATITVTINWVNTTPFAVDDEASTNEDTPVTFNATDNDYDVDGTINVATVDLNLSIAGRQTSYTVAGEGTYTVDLLGNVTFTPVLNYNGRTTPVSYSVNDNMGLSSDLVMPATITVTVAPVNDVPTAVNDAITAPSNVDVIFNITDNDTDLDGTIDPSTIDLDPSFGGIQKVYTVAGQGTYTVDNTGILTFSPLPSFIGPVTCTAINYTVSDNSGGKSNSATITITLTDPSTPVAVNDDSTTNEDTPVTIADITANDILGSGSSFDYTKIDLNTATAGVQTSVTNAFGTWAVNTSTGEVVYTPLANFNGTATIVYVVADDLSLISNEATIAVTVNPVNDAPVISNFTLNGLEDITLAFTPEDFTTHYTDVENSALNGVKITSLPSNGTLMLNTSAVAVNDVIAAINLGNITFIPNANWNGSTTFNWNATDGTSYAGTQRTATLTIAAVNDIPSFTAGANQTACINSGSNSVANWATLISAGPANEAAQTLTFTVSNTNNTLFSIQPAVSSAGTLTYTLANGQYGTATLSVNINDNGGTANNGVDASAIQTFTLTVDPVSVGESIAGGGTVCSGTNSSTLTLSGHTGTIVKWQSSTDGWITPVNIANTTTTQTVTNLTTTTSYRVVLTNGTCTINSSAATVTVNSVTPGSVESDQNITIGNNPAAFVVLTAASGAGTLSYQWQKSTTSASAGFSNIAGATSASFDESTNLAVDTWYKRITTSTLNTVACSAESNVLKVSIITCEGPAIVNSPTSPSAICAGSGSVDLNVDATGSDLTYQWYVGGTTALTESAPYSNVTSETLTITNPSFALNGKQYTVKVSGGCGPTTLTSNAATLTVDPVSVGGSIAGGATVCSGTNSTTLTLSGNTGAVVKWQSSTDNWTTPVDIANTTTTLTATNLVATTKYRAVVQSGTCSTANSSDAAVTVDPVSVGGSIAGGATVCSGTNSTTLTLSGNTGAVIKWQSSTDNWTTPVDIANTTTTLTATNLVTTTKYRAVVQSGTCSTANSSDAAVTVDPILTPVASVSSQPDCNSSTGTITITSPTGSGITYSINGLTYTGSMVYAALNPGNYSVTAKSSGGCISSATVLTIFPVGNCAPVAINDAGIVNQNETLNGSNLLANDSDTDGNLLTINTNPASSPVHGTLIINSNGTYTYKPDPEYYGTDSFIYQVCDNGTPSLCTTAKVSITVKLINDTPVAVDDHATVNEDEILNGSNLLANDTDTDGNILAINTTPVSGPAHGTLVIHANGTYTYKPNANYFGNDSFTYQVCDNGSPVLCATAKVSITVNPVNDPPVALDDAANVHKNNTLTGSSLLSNDSDPEGNSLTINTIPVSGPAHGTLVINPNGTYSYTPANNYLGTDTFVYQVCDNGIPSQCVTAKVILHILDMNFPPVALDDAIVMNEDETYTGTSLLSNDSDPDGNTLSISTTPVIAPSHGTLVINANGTYTYKPNANYFGNDSFTYQVCDNGTPVLCATAKVTITVNPVNDPPVAQDDVVVMKEDETYSGTSLLSNDSDPDGNTLSISTTPVIAPSHGTLVINANGTYTYKPNANYFGNDSFTYQVCDNGTPVLCASARVTITVNAINHVPVAVDDINKVSNGLPISGSVSANNDIPSLDGGNIWSLKRGVFHGRLIFNSDGSFVYTPDIRYDGQDSFIYQVCDRDGDCDEATVFITVVSPKADLLVNKTVDNRSPKIGESVVFTVTVTNYGPENATGVQLTDKLPSGCIYTSSAVSTGTYNNQTGLWSIGNMTSNMTATMTVKAKIYSRGDYKNVATISGDQNDPNATNNSSEVLLDEICELFVPEIFSPNNDGIQDYFKIRCIDRYLNAKIEIYNRWGNLVYQKDHYGDTDFWGTTEAWWDGKSNQKWKLGTELLPPATYFYVLYLNNGSEKRNGYLYLNR